MRCIVKRETIALTSKSINRQEARRTGITSFVMKVIKSPSPTKNKKFMTNPTMSHTSLTVAFLLAENQAA